MDERAPWLLVGLGNPGREYAANRHNVGFMVVERWLDRHWPPGISDPWREKFHGRYAVGQGSFGRCIVLQPHTYMNRSGKSVLAAAQFFRVPPQQIVVAYDEIDFEFGRIAVKNGGGHGGHNGIRDLVTLLPSRDFLRVRVGVGRPTRGGDVAGWVLGNFVGTDLAELPDVVDRAEQAVSAIVERGVGPAMNEFNQAPANKP
ncbi:MAG: aminoacyl-tRNA hydrolase [Nannocystaceae bacterium]|nr:aminoacyl-tRNA hydrolase [Nannocystaceae bacterium]